MRCMTVTSCCVLVSMLPLCLVCLADMSRAASAEPDFYTQTMNVLCPLDDECLPLEAANLKTRQVRKCSECSLHASKHTASAGRKLTGWGLASALLNVEATMALPPSRGVDGTSIAVVWVLRCVSRLRLPLRG